MNINIKKCKRCKRLYDFEKCPYCGWINFYSEEIITPLSKSKSLNKSKHIMNKFDNKINLTPLSIGGM